MQVNSAQAQAPSVNAVQVNAAVSADEEITKAESLLRRSCEFYRHLDSFSGELKTDTILTKQGLTTHKTNSLSF